MSAVNHQMIILARESRGLSQAELSKKLKSISQANYSRMEKGIVVVNDDHIREISEALNYPVGFFKRESALTTQTEYFYRKKSTLPKKEQTKLEATFDLIRIWFNEILSDIEIPAYNLPEIEIVHQNTPEVAAAKTRRYLGVGRGPIEALIQLLEKNGVIIYQLYNVPEKFDGTTVITKSGVRVIVINGDMPNYRKKYTISHEVAHLICHIPFPSDDPYKETKDIESEANNFAAAFLMPAEEAQLELRNLTYSKLHDLKRYWKVSKSAIIRRAYDVGCITKDKYTNLMIEMSRYNERRSEKFDVPLDEPKILKKVLDLYRSELEYSDEELMEALTISREDFQIYVLNKSSIFNLRIAL